MPPGFARPWTTINDCTGATPPAAGNEGAQPAPRVRPENSEVSYTSVMGLAGSAFAVSAAKDANEEPGPAEGRLASPPPMMVTVAPSLTTRVASRVDAPSVRSAVAAVSNFKVEAGESAVWACQSSRVAPVVGSATQPAEVPSAGLRRSGLSAASSPATVGAGALLPWTGMIGSTGEAADCATAGGCVLSPQANRNSDTSSERRTRCVTSHLLGGRHHSCR